MKRAILVILSVALAACGASGGGDGLTEIRFMNLIADSDRVIFQVEDESFPTVNFGLATAYRSFGGTYDYDLELVNPDGTLTNLVEDRSLTVDGDNEWTFYAVGTVAAGDFIPVIAANGDPAENFTKIQIVNSTQASLTASVYANGQLVAGLQYSATVGPRSYVEPTEVSSQSVQIRVERSDGSVAFESSPFTLASQGDVTFVLTDYLGPGPAVAAGEVLMVDHSGAVAPVATPGRLATLRYIHALTNLSDATVTRTDPLQASTDTTLSFATASAREMLDADTYDITVAPAANVGAPVYNTSEALVANVEYSLLLIGDLATPDSLLLTDATRPVANAARVSLSHAAPGLGEVDVYVSVPGEENLSGTVFVAVAHRATLRIDAPGAARVVTIANTGTTDVVAGPLEVDLSVGSVETLLLHDAETGGAPFGLSKL